MANQRSKNKKVISVPLPKEVLDIIEADAAKQGTDRVKIINALLRKALKLSPLIFAVLWFQFPQTRPAIRSAGKALASFAESAAAQVAKL